MQAIFKQIGVLGALSLACLVVLVFFQGGYMQLASCLVGCVLVVLGAVSVVRAVRQGRALAKPALLFLAVAGAYLLSALVNGLTLTTVTSAGTWFGVAGFACMVGSSTAEWRRALLVCFKWLSLAMAVVSLVGFAADFAPFIDGDRLQFTIQYANATAIWFVTTVFLCVYSKSAWERALLPVVLVDIFLTQSFGALLAAGLVVLGLGVFHGLQARKGKSQEGTPFCLPRLVALIVQVVFSLAFFAAIWVSPIALKVVLAVALLAACVAYKRFNVEEALAAIPAARQKDLVVAVAAVIVVGVVGIFLFANDRVLSAWAHLLERFVQIHDGALMWATAPLFGVGPDNWQYLYPYLQTAQYHSATIHGSYMKIAVDAGLLGVAAFVAAAVLGLKALACRKEELYLACAVVILLHFTIDFDARFTALLCVLALLLCVAPGSAEAGKDEAATSTAAGVQKAPKGRAGRMVATIACAAVSLFLCALGSLAGFVSSTASFYSSVGAVADLQDMCESNVLARTDIGLQNETVIALANVHANQQIEAFYRTHGISSDVQAVYYASALFQLGKGAEAQLILVNQMEKQPGNYELFQAANEYFAAYGLDQSLMQRYDAALARANNLTTQGVAPQLESQHFIEHF